MCTCSDVTSGALWETLSNCAKHFISGQTKQALSIILNICTESYLRWQENPISLLGSKSYMKEAFSQKFKEFHFRYRIFIEFLAKLDEYLSIIIALITDISPIWLKSENSGWTYLLDLDIANSRNLALTTQLNKAVKRTPRDIPHDKSRDRVTWSKGQWDHNHETRACFLNTRQSAIEKIMTERQHTRIRFSEEVTSACFLVAWHRPISRSVAHWAGS